MTGCEIPKSQKLLWRDHVGLFSKCSCLLQLLLALLTATVQAVHTDRAHHWHQYFQGFAGGVGRWALLCLTPLKKIRVSTSPRFPHPLAVMASEIISYCSATKSNFMDFKMSICLCEASATNECCSEHWGLLLTL